MQRKIMQFLLEMKLQFKEIVILLVFIIIFTVGLNMSLNSVTMGIGFADNKLSQHGGTLDGASYDLYRQESIKTYRELGNLLLILGGLGEIVHISIMQIKDRG